MFDHMEHRLKKLLVGIQLKIRDFCRKSLREKLIVEKVLTNFENQDYSTPLTAAARLCRIGNDIDEMYAKDESCACAFRLKKAATMVLITAPFVGTLAVRSPSLLEFIPLADGEPLENKD